MEADGLYQVALVPAACPLCQAPQTRVFVAGFGVIIEGTSNEYIVGNLSSTVRYAEQQLVDRATCAAAIVDPVAAVLNDNDICAGPVPPLTSGADSCFGDGGGPLFYDASGMFEKTRTISMLLFADSHLGRPSDQTCTRT